jgi:hypothetical protein
MDPGRRLHLPGDIPTVRLDGPDVLLSADVDPELCGRRVQWAR